ncbi:MAG: phosphoribosylanthranilate isomerase [Nitrososphaerota archaeon]|nr:phosphoribosylanthranilate isomerase [Nitrososphaerota archaeon]
MNDVAAAIAAGADSLGFVSGYPDSPRNLSFKKLRKIMLNIPPFVSSVVVTPTSNKDIKKILSLAPSYLQTYGGLEWPQEVLCQNVIQTVRPLGDASTVVDKAIYLAKRSKAILFDGSLTSKYSKADYVQSRVTLEDSWKTARLVNKALGRTPLILGGGLTADNVERAIRFVRPYAVDVSSGVESSPGLKDKDKIFRFVRNARKTTK